VTQIHVLLLLRTRWWTFGFHKPWIVSCLAFQKVRCWLGLVSLLPANLLAVVAFFVRSSKNSSQETPIRQRSVRTRTQVKGAGILITTVTCSQNRAHYLYWSVAEGWGLRAEGWGLRVWWPCPCPASVLRRYGRKVLGSICGPRKK